MVYIGVDLGGTNIAVGMVSEDGSLIHKVSTPTLSQRGQAAVIEDIIRTCRQLVEDTRTEWDNVGAVGVGSPGVCDSACGVIEYNANLGFQNARVCDEINKNLKLDVFLDNDGNCAALGECMGGAAKGRDISATITLGTGIGGGIVIGGKLLKGAFGTGGEVGHHVIQMDGIPCTCGKAGCWEAYASVTGLIRMAKAEAEDNPDGGLLKVANGNLDGIDGRTVFLAARRGDDAAKIIIDKYLRYVSCGLANIINIIQPEIIVIGGGISAQGEVILQPIRRYTAEDVFNRHMQTEIVVSGLRNDAGIIGAAMLGKR